MKQSDIRAAAKRYRVDEGMGSLREALAADKDTAFLCHSHKDQSLVKGVVKLLNEGGWNVYVDWLDEELPSAPNSETAEKIRGKIVQMNWFLFLATANSVSSRWCPWEIGIADGKKANRKILIIATEDDAGNWYGNEYLHLYRRLRSGHSEERSGYGVFEAGSGSGAWISTLNAER